MGPLGVQEMVVIFLVALVLFGPRKLPELAKTIGKAVTEFRRAQSDLKATFQREMQSIERENESLKEVTRQTAAELSSYSEIDLTGGLSGSYDTNARTDEFTPDHPTVSASAILGAESQAESQSTVPGSTSGAEQASLADSNPLPEFEQSGEGASAKTADAELPSIV
jgi:sec-independent protein translocase protein TatA